MKNFLITSCLIILLLPILTFAQGYEPLVGIPGVNPNASGGFDTYINTLYALSISIAALLAVIKIIIAGVKLMMTDIVTTKGEAKKDIQGALIGLLIVLAAVLILTVINPNLAKVDLQLNTVQTQSLSPNSNFSGLPFTPNPGDSPSIIDSRIPESQRQMFCESRSEELCKNSNRGIGCYTGEYYKVDDKEICVVRKDNNITAGVKYECDWVGEGIPPTDLIVDTEAQRNTWLSDWDCSAAQQKCDDAGFDYDTDYFWIGVRKVECEWD